MTGMTLEEQVVRMIRFAGKRATSLLKVDPLFLGVVATGSGQKDQIIEIAVADSHYQVRFESHVKPTIPIPGATKLVKAPFWPVVLRQLASSLDNRPLIIYNLERTARLADQTNEAWWGKDIIDPLNLKLWQQNCAQLLAGYAFGCPGDRLSLAEATDLAGIKCGTGAVEAAQATAKLVLAMAAFGQFLEASGLYEFVRQ